MFYTEKNDFSWLICNCRPRALGRQTYRFATKSLIFAPYKTIYYFQYIENCLFRNIPFYIIGYSFGTLVALEMISLLERNGYPGIMILIDGSPAYSTSSLKKQFAHETEAQFQTAILSKISAFVIPLDVFSQYEVNGYRLICVYITRVHFLGNVVEVQKFRRSNGFVSFVGTS